MSGFQRILALRDELAAAIAGLPYSLDAASSAHVPSSKEPSFEDVKEVLDLQEMMLMLLRRRATEGGDNAAAPATWVERQRAASEYRAAIAGRLGPALQARLLLEGIESSRCTGAVEEELLRLLQGGGTDVACVDRVWNLVRNGKIEVASGSPWLSCAALVEHALKPRASVRRTSAARGPEDGYGDESSDDDAEAPNHPSVTPAEAFLVLLALEGKKGPGKDDAAIALRISQECDPRLSYQPSGSPVRVLEGELLSQIAAAVDAAQLSPAIRHRREVGLVFENSAREYYRYDPAAAPEFERYCLAGFGGFGSTLSVELPHLVYALVDRVEIDVIPSPSYGVPAVEYVSPGAEVMLRPFSKKTLEPFVRSKKRPEVATVTGHARAPARVCTHVSVRLDRTASVVAVRLYGLSICFGVSALRPPPQNK